MELPKKMTVTSDLERNLIFSTLQKIGEPLNISVDDIEYKGYVTDYNQHLVTVELETPTIGEIEGTRHINFVFNNNYHYFTAEVARKAPEQLAIILPAKIYKNILRKHVRVNVEGTAFMKFKVMIQSEKRELEKSMLVDERVIYQEVRKLRPNIEKLLRGIKNLVTEFSQSMQIKVFKPDEPLSFEEKIISDTGKPFLIYDSYEDSIGQQRFYEDQLLTVNSAYDFYISRGEVRKAVEARLLDLLQLKRNRRVFSECLVPLMLEGEAVGCLKLTNDIDYHRSIKPAFVERAQKYAGILVEALVKYDYFSLESGSAFDIPVIDISAGGLLFRLNKPELKQYLIDQTVLQMSIRFPARQIQARGMIFRRDDERSEYGVKFQEINELDARYIEDLAHKEKNG
jgi:hypothetical protein